MSKKPKFEDTLPLDEEEEVSQKPKFEDTLPVEEVQASGEDFVLPPKQEIPPGDIYDTLSDIAATSPQGVTTWADEIAAALKTAIRVGGGEKTPPSEVFESEINPIRQRIALARERSPVATTLSEAGTGILSSFNPILGAGKLAGAGSMIARGALEGVGTAEDKTNLEDVVTQAGIGGGISALGSLVSGGLKKVTSADPNKIRANVLGARTSEFKEIGIKERENIAKELKNMGLFSNTKVQFDVEKGKFVPVGKSLENLEKPATQKLSDRLGEALEKIQEAKIKIIDRVKDMPVSMDEISNLLDEVSVKFAKKATDKAGRMEDAQKLKDIIMADIMDDMEELGLEQPTLGLLEAAKKRLSDDVSNFGKNPLLAKTPYSSDLYNQFYSGLNKKLRRMFPDPKYAEYNDMQQKMLTAKADLSKAIASEDAQKAQVGATGWVNKIISETLGSPEAGLGVAATKEAIDRMIPKSIQSMTKLGVQESPFGAIRYLDSSIPKAEIPFAPEQSEQSGGGMFKNVRPAFPFNVPPEEQIKNIPKSGMITPKQLLKYRIPASTEGILANKEMVLAKIAQAGVPGDMYETIAYTLNENPEKIGNIAPLVMAEFPTLFEEKKYKMFDGIILDPADRAKAADDTSKRDDLGSLQKSKIIRELNKSGKWLGE